MRFEGISALVTGGAAGIGKATVERLSAEGAHVGVLDLAGTEHEPAVVVDIADLDAVPWAVGELAEALGSMDLLVNCAGWDGAQPFVETDRAFWEKIVGINLLGPIAVTHAALPLMSDGGAIVNVASDAGRVGSTGEVVHSGAKGGVIGFTKALAREVARRQIRVNAIAPGPTDTALLDSFDPGGQLAEAITKQTPLRKLGTPDEGASEICFLSSADAGHITGQVLSVSGGLTMV
jgi:2-hydroxycyclohexanecarboxyl-CoA dehydrogenase